MPVLETFKILAVAEQAGLSIIWSQTPGRQVWVLFGQKNYRSLQTYWI